MNYCITHKIEAFRDERGNLFCLVCKKQDAEFQALREVAEAAKKLCEAAWHDGAPDAIARWARAREKFAVALSRLPGGEGGKDQP